MRADGARVTAARKAAKLSQGDLVTRMRKLGQRGTDLTWVAMVEGGRWPDSPEATLTALAAALGVGLTDILPVDQATGRLILQLAGELEAVARHLEAAGTALCLLPDPLAGELDQAVREGGGHVHGVSRGD